MDDVLKALGIEPVPSLVGFIWREETEQAKGKEIAGFLTAVTQANAVLANVRCRLGAPAAIWSSRQTDAEFAAIKAYYRAGIPAPWSGAETQSAEKLTQVLVERRRRSSCLAMTRSSIPSCSMRQVVNAPTRGRDGSGASAGR